MDTMSRQQVIGQSKVTFNTPIRCASWDEDTVTILGWVADVEVVTRLRGARPHGPKLPPKEPT